MAKSLGKFSRRGFLAASGVGVAGGFFGLPAIGQDEPSKSASEQPVVGYIGTGIRYHTALGPGGMAFGPCAKIADVDSVQAGRALQAAMDEHRKKDWPLNTTVHEDYQHVLDDPSIDVVFVGSPDHWHTKHVIEAMQAGKDVYCEKPLTLTIDEGTQIENVIKQTGRIVQVGTQQRTEFGSMFAKAAAMVREQRVGDLKRVTVAIGGSRICKPIPIVEPPRNLNWDKWLGQCPVVDYRQAADIVDTKGWGAGHPFGRTHRYYRWWYEYSGGKLTDWGAHHVDIAMLALDKLRDDVGLIQIEPISVVHPVKFVDGMPQEDDRFNAATAFNVKVTFSDGLEMFVCHSAQESLGFDNGIMFEGSDGRFLVNRGKLVGKPVEALESDPLSDDPFKILYGRSRPDSHIGNFMECVKTRKQPISDVASHNAMLNVCHAVNIAMRLERPLKYDPKARRFVDDERANQFIAREQRAGYEVKV